MKLFAFPCEGMTRSIYFHLHDSVHKNIEFIPVELSGRGERADRALSPTIEEMAADFYKHHFDELRNSRYALFGHGMGCMIIYELLEIIRKKNLNRPTHLFFSGKCAPGTETMNIKYSAMDDEDLADCLSLLNALPQSSFDNGERLAAMLPVIRNDFVAVERYIEDPVFIADCKVSVLMGYEEYFNAEQITGWKYVTGCGSSITFFRGDHFFLIDDPKSVARLINNELEQYLH